MRTASANGKTISLQLAAEPGAARYSLFLLDGSFRPVLPSVGYFP